MKSKTSKFLCTALVAAALFMGSNVKAQSTTPNPLRFGIGVEGLLPVGDASNTLNFGLGITPRLQYTVSDKVALTFTSGLYHFFPKTLTYPSVGSSSSYSVKYKSDIIPVKVGAKFFVCPHFYLSGEVGAAFEVAEGGGPVHFLASPGFGFANKKWDIGARYENYNGNDGLVGLRLAYGFGL